MAMRSNILLWVVILVVGLIGISSSAHGEQPLESLQRNTEEAIRVLKDPRYKEVTQKEVQREKLRELSYQAFDFVEFSRRVLANNWEMFTPQQRIEFVDVFAKFMTNFYLRLVQERYRDEKVVYLSQELITDSRALVKISVLVRNREVPVDIRMVKRNGTWKAYDVMALGISAVMFYRSQFEWILRKESPAQVIERLKRRVKEQEKGLEGVKKIDVDSSMKYTTLKKVPFVITSNSWQGS
jgi:phospholipid transport system substrate-binding protein